ncbi:MAG TPA: asparagine synthase (glutamine-hydrolyzing) [bacterium]
MCGIVGLMLRRPLEEADLRASRAGIAALRHRGPDDAGEWADRDSGVVFGHARLAVIDPSPASRQPFVRDGWALAYNGELYNFRELREELAAQGVRCSTTGDTEVVLEAWRRWGPEALERFDGMMAFALFDGRRVHLVTDPFGEKPLYLAETPEGVHVSSEPGPLAARLGLPKRLSAEETTAYLCLGFVPPPGTGYAGLERLGPGMHVVIERGALVSRRRYWRAPEPLWGRGPVRPLPERTLDRIADALVASLRRRVYADVPLGIFLSAGVDSALVAALAVRELKLRPLALTVAFPDGRDESARAAAIARHLETPHEIVDSRAERFRASGASVLALYGELNDNLTAASVHQIASAAVSRMTVALCGMGGDELFYGYGRYQVLYRMRAALALPAALRQALGGMVRGPLARSGTLRTASALLGAGDAARVLAVKHGRTAPWLRTQPGFETMAQRWFPDSRQPLMVAARQFDLDCTMPGSYIPAMERGSMRASLEVRTPFLSRALLETVSAEDQRAFAAFGQKSVLRRLLARYVPSRLTEFPKSGFMYPPARLLADGPQRPPRPPGVDPASARAVWARRSEHGWQLIAVRLAILEAFVTGAMPEKSDARDLAEPVLAN